MRRAIWSGPAVQRASLTGPSCPAPGMSRRAFLSNTTQTASPRRKTAAPTGVGQANDRLTWAGVATAVTGTVPAAAVCVSAGAAAGGVSYRFSQTAPSAEPERASAPSARVRTSSVPPRTARVSTLSTPRGGSTLSRDTSGAAVEPMRTMTLRPSRRTCDRAPMTPANSIRVNSVLEPMRIAIGSSGAEDSWASGVRGANSTAPAAAAATEVLSMRFLAAAPDIRAHTRARGLSGRLTDHDRLTASGPLRKA